MDLKLSLALTSAAMKSHIGDMLDLGGGRRERLTSGPGLTIHIKIREKWLKENL